MSNHAPGPWTIEDADLAQRFYIMANSNPQPGSKVVCALVRSDGLTQAANARLIAAAPDLLAAVSELLDSLDAIHPELEEELKASADNTTSKFGAGLIESYRRATAALKKANGGEA